MQASLCDCETICSLLPPQYSSPYLQESPLSVFNRYVSLIPSKSNCFLFLPSCKRAVAFLIDSLLAFAGEQQRIINLHASAKMVFDCPRIDFLSIIHHFLLGSIHSDWPLK